MTTNSELKPVFTPRANYVLLSADTLNLIFPQHEVGEVEYLEGVLEAGDEQGILQLSGAKDTRRFAALSTRMTLLPHCPSDRFLVAPIGDENENLGWCWKELRLLIDVELKPQPIPAVLLTPDSPVSYFVDFEGKVAYLCSARQLSAFALASRN